MKNTLIESVETRRQKHKLQSAIVERAIKDLGYDGERISLTMDLCSCPDLDLERLLAFPPFDFAHDVCGIIRHMDRSTYPGTLKDCFVPRASR